MQNRNTNPKKMISKTNQNKNYTQMIDVQRTHNRGRRGGRERGQGRGTGKGTKNPMNIENINTKEETSGMHKKSLTFQKWVLSVLNNTWGIFFIFLGDLKKTSCARSAQKIYRIYGVVNNKN